MKPLDFTGQRLGILTILRTATPDEIPVTKSQLTHPQRWWIVKCDCGNIKAVRAGSLKNGDSRSCGCRVDARRASFGKSQARPTGEAAKWAAYVTGKRHAERRGLIWALSLEHFLYITSQPCTYCGALGSKETPKTTNGTYRYSGIDRIENRIGYIPLNCAPCCGTCNAAKGIKTIAEFRTWMMRAYEVTVCGRDVKR